MGLWILRAESSGESISLRVTILGSGSSGNCTLLETERTRLLVDAGLGKKETLRRLAAVGREVDRLDGIVISHEHSDHIGSLAQVLGQWRTTVYLTEATHTEVLRILPETSHKRLDRVEHIRAGQRFIVGDIEVSPISIPHDAVDPLGFTFRANGTKVAIVTDLGYLPELVKVHLRDSDCLMLESNHDLDMLKVGPYPWHIKQRVMSRTGTPFQPYGERVFRRCRRLRRARAVRCARASFREQQQSRRGAHLGRRSARPAHRRRGIFRRIDRRLAGFSAPHTRFVNRAAF